MGSSSQSSVVAVLTNDRPSVEILLGALAVGARLVSLPLPARGANPERYASFVREMSAAFGADQVVARDDVAALLASLGVPAVGHSALRRGSLAAHCPEGFELVQFSSGSTSAPKAVALSDEQLGTNVEAILTALQPRSGDCTVSWLPLSHDMGLVGMLLASLAAAAPRWVGGVDIVVLEPERFLRAPDCWTGALSEWRGTFTAAPDFAYRMAHRSGPASLDLDLSSVRCAIVGGEVVRADTLRSFAAAFAAAGFNPLALCPAYGLAELGLAASMVRPDIPWTSTPLNRDALAEGRRVTAAEAGGGIEVVSNGTPIPGYAVDTSADPGRIGSLRISGPSIGRDGLTGRTYADENGTLLTGDVGFVEAGEVYPCGRGDDYLLVHGRNVFAPAIERAVDDVAGVRRGRVGAVAALEGDWAVVVEAAGRAPVGGARRDLIHDITRAALSEAGARPTEILVVATGTLPMTSSGKLQRQLLRTRWTKGELSLI